MSDIDLEKRLRRYFPLGFPLSREMWERLDLQPLLVDDGYAATASDVYQVRLLAERFNERQRGTFQTGSYLIAGHLVTVGTIVDVLRYVFELYCHSEHPGVITAGLSWTERRTGSELTKTPPPCFVSLFPPQSVVRKKTLEGQYLGQSEAGVANHDTVVGELVLLSLAVANPAFKPFRTLFDDTDLSQRAPYRTFVQNLESFFDTQPVFGPLGMPLIKCLRAPMENAPDSLEGQLEYIRRHWASFLPASLMRRLAMASDILREENRLRGLGPGPAEVLRFVTDAYGAELSYAEPAAFSRDADWMSNVVLIAKSTYVWMDQLSKQYGRHIRLLSDIPDEELDRLARWGFTGLWLIGIWERSPASQKIKQIMGNPEAASSAYSLYDYMIAEDLGGEAAFASLRDRAWQRGIRLASDMVPNHTGVYSRWVIEHPDWYMQSSHQPFPVYRFSRDDLSLDSRVLLQIEDGYWDRRDAAVVFKRVDKWTGDTRYIYHGNDGTSMPWNDTAQLNFMLPEVREAVIQLILHVARKTPIIRFDAAMTLAKRHYQRLWFPQQGEGGAIPSRAEHGMTKAQFDQAFPKEFWREVVDRVAAELPDTLLLAEAFWLMEGYFVRTLGMHRVYNSAFMNMLKMEDNAKFRQTIKNVLEFSPEVVKRFVNFMSNPDEATAVEQFGKGDKYYGVAVLMVTMPGLPMFGHGQVEGFTEKYGMEYRRAYWDEQVDEWMVRRHEASVFPLMRRRHLFSGSENFALFDFNTDHGWIDENVFAFTNRAGDERAIILYNNAYNTTAGRIQLSTAINIGTADQKHLVRKTLPEALGLNAGDTMFYVFRDYQSGLEYIRSGRQLATEGFYTVLYGYQYRALLDWREVCDMDGVWSQLAYRLEGNGVPDMETARRELMLEPVLGPLRHVLDTDLLNRATIAAGKTLPDLKARLSAWYKATGVYVNCSVDGDALAAGAVALVRQVVEDESTTVETVSLRSAPTDQTRECTHWVLAFWAILRGLGQVKTAAKPPHDPALAVKRFDDWMLHKPVVEALQRLGKEPAAASLDTVLVRLLLSVDLLLKEDQRRPVGLWQAAFEDRLARQYLQVNEHAGVLWFNKEQFERLAWTVISAISARHAETGSLTPADTARLLALYDQIVIRAERAGYRVKQFLELSGTIEID